MDMEAKIEELKKDIAELEALVEQATRQKVKDILTIQFRKVATDLCNLQEQVRATTTSPQSTEKVVSVAPSSNKRCLVKISNYGYDDQLEYIVFHIMIPNVQKVPKDNINCVVQERSVGLTVKDLDNKDYVFNLDNLADKIVHTDNNWKLKKDRIEIRCQKQIKGLWKFVTLHEKKVAAVKKAEIDQNAKPEDGIFSLIKNMYDTGDDSMKQTISKAWEESRMKQPNF